MRYDYCISHVPQKYIYTADTLSCDPTIITTSLGDYNLKDIEHFVKVQVESLPASKERLDVYRQAQMNDSLCSQVIKYCQSSWPEKHAIQCFLKPYWTVRSELTVCNNLLLFNKRIVVPESLTKETLDKIHEGHQGIQRSCFRATSSVWWPGLSKEIVQTVPKREGRTPLQNSH